MSKKIIIAPLNWGWGHATRCIPIIQLLLKKRFTPVLASDGDALALLKKEFPELETLELPSYNIHYKKNFSLGLFLNIPDILKAIQKEKKVIDDYVFEYDEVIGIVSDNRPGVFNSKVESVYISHQLNIKIGLSTPIINNIHHRFIKKFDHCWIPDEPNHLLTGRLTKTEKIKGKFIGVLSRFEKTNDQKKYDLLVLLSGIKEQRGRLEEILVKELRDFEGEVIFIRGLINPEKDLNLSDNFTVVNYMLAKELEKAMNQSTMVLSRSGYTTIMDLAKLNKKAFLIPTPGQTEQEYLAKYLQDQNKIKSCIEEGFSKELLNFSTEKLSIEQEQDVSFLEKEMDVFLKNTKIRQMRKFFSFLVLSILTINVIYGQRQHFKISKDWKFQSGEIKEGSLSSFDDSAWKKIDLPHDWSIHSKHSESNTGRNAWLPGGKSWYRKHIFIQENAKNKKIELQFDGSYRHSSVWINNHYVGAQYDGYTSFYFDITPFVKVGEENTIAVEVDNSVQPNCRWYSGSGIYRDVWLTITNPLHIQKWGTFITTPEISSEKAKVNIETTIENLGEKVSYTLETKIYDQNAKLIKRVTTKPQTIFQNAVDINQSVTISEPKKWSIEEPNLYAVESVVTIDGKVVDTYKSTFGIRDIRFDADKGFFLNGKNLKMKGVCMHHEAGTLGAAVPIAVWERRLDKLKAIGCNAIRTAHNPMTKEFLDLCDKKGFLVMNEFVDKWGASKSKQEVKNFTFFNPYGFGDPYFELEWEKNYRETIKRDRNHPSVIIWSVGNENYSSSEAAQKAGLRKYASFVRTLDPTRPVISGMKRDRNGDYDVDQIVRDIVETTKYMDFVAMNYGEQWVKKIHKLNPNVPYLSTESYTYFNSTPEVRFANIERSPWLDVMESDFNMGLFLWVGFDYLGEAKKWPYLGIGCGLHDLGGFRKRQSYLYEAFWSEKPVVHVEVYDGDPEDFSTSGRWRWPAMSENWNREKGEKVNLATYTNCDEVRLYLNKKLIGTQKLKDNPNWIIKWRDITYKEGVLKAVGVKNSKEVCEHILQTTAAPKKLNLKVYKEVVSFDEMIQVEVFLLDKKGRSIKNIEKDLNYTVEGGKIIAIENGDINYRESIQNLDVYPTHNGRSICYIQSNKGVHEVKLMIEGEGIKKSTATIKVK